MYKDADSELFDKCCKNIESETQGNEVVVECQWNSDELSFHIAGFEEGVTLAIHLIQSEFEAYDLMNESSSDESHACSVSGRFAFLLYNCRSIPWKFCDHHVSI